MKCHLMLTVMLIWPCGADHAAPRLFVGASNAQADERRVSKASASVEVSQDIPLIVVRITNLAAVPLESWKVHVVYRLSSGAPGSTDYLTETIFSEAPDFGPVPPGGFRDKRIPLTAVATSAQADIETAFYGDLTWEGNSHAVAEALQWRERHARTLQIWIDAFTEAAGQSREEATKILRKVLESESSRAQAKTDSLAISAQKKVAAVLETDENTRALGDTLLAMKHDFQKKRAKALRHRAHQ